jgi:membrane-bound lytic murein transglycosylase
VVYDPYYKTRKSGKRIADFALATHDKEDATHYWRIRAFDKTAERVRDNVRRGQTGVEAVVYGPKYWHQKKKTKDGEWIQETVKGYYAGMVRVPQKHREKPQGED